MMRGKPVCHMLELTFLGTFYEKHMVWSGLCPSVSHHPHPATIFFLFSLLNILHPPQVPHNMVEPH